MASNHHVALHPVDGLLQFAALRFAVAHGRKARLAEMVILLEGGADGTNRHTAIKSRTIVLHARRVPRSQMTPAP